MTAFDTALAALHADANLSSPAVWRTGGKGAGVALRVIRHVADSDLDMFQKVNARRDQVHIIAALATPQRDDTVTLLDASGTEIERLVITSAIQDFAGITWICDVRRM